MIHASKPKQREKENERKKNIKKGFVDPQTKQNDDIIETNKITGLE